MSLVRNNQNNNIGFLADPRRMNVAVTRAKRHFMLIGSAKMLNTTTKLKNLAKEFYQNGIVLSPTEYYPDISEFREVKNIKRRR